MKQLPQNIDAEKSVLGACLSDNQVIGAVSQLLTADDFYSSAHHVIFSAITRIHNAHKPVDIITLTNELRTLGVLDNIGGTQFIMDINSVGFETASVEHYAEIVLEKSRLRALYKTAQGIGIAVNDGDLSSSVILEDSIRKLIELNDRSARHKGNDCWHISEGVREIHEAISENFPEGIYSKTYIKTGLVDFDELCGGLMPGYLHLLGGRPGMGKSTLAISMALNIAHNGKRVCFFSFEISKMMTVQRLLAKESRVGSSVISKGEYNPIERKFLVSDRQYQALTSGCGSLSGLPLWGFSKRRPLLDIKQDLDKIEMAHGKPDVVFIDRLEFISEPVQRGENRTQYLDRISAELAQLAKDRNIPIVLLLQLSRECEKRQDKHPMLSDLRDSGGLEQNAKAVLFVYRDEYYDPKSNNGIAEVVVAKYSDGQTGTVKTRFLDFIPSFENLGVEQ